ncbi:type 1 fimbrial major subunit FimA [Serratia liquefaciens]|uniref:type 1 fimbrial major subunit FimA n=1 Tax=Serratia liquefaciens TaxID=614 RepID=UPI0038001409
MKINKLGIAVGAVMSLATCLSHAASNTVSGGTIHFRGSLVDAACSVSADSADQIVDLGQYTLHHFKSKGTATNAIPFKIKLEDCDTTVSSTAAVAFSGQVDATSPNLLAVDSSAGGNSDNGASASGVGIQIVDSASKNVIPDGTTFSTPKKLIDGENILDFTAHYVSTVDKPTAGQANSDATFIMQYQ